MLGAWSERAMKTHTLPTSCGAVMETFDLGAGIEAGASEQAGERDLAFVAEAAIADGQPWPVHLTATTPPLGTFMTLR